MLKFVHSGVIIKIIVVMRIRGLVNLITGGASGLGLGTARHLVSQGSKVILLDNNEKAGAESVKEWDERMPTSFPAMCQMSNKSGSLLKKPTRCTGTCESTSTPLPFIIPKTFSKTTVDTTI